MCKSQRLQIRKKDLDNFRLHIFSSYFYTVIKSKEVIYIERDELIKLIQEKTMESGEVIEYLGISKQRLSDMNRTGKLIAVKKGIYLREDVEKRKLEQDELRGKYYKR